MIELLTALAFGGAGLAALTARERKFRRLDSAIGWRLGWASGSEIGKLDDASVAIDPRRGRIVVTPRLGLPEALEVWRPSVLDVTLNDLFVSGDQELQRSVHFKGPEDWLVAKLDADLRHDLQLLFGAAPARLFSGKLVVSIKDRVRSGDVRLITSLARISAKVASELARPISVVERLRRLGHEDPCPGVRAQVLTRRLAGEDTFSAAEVRDVVRDSGIPMALRARVVSTLATPDLLFAVLGDRGAAKTIAALEGEARYERVLSALTSHEEEACGRLSMTAAGELSPPCSS